MPERFIVTIDQRHFKIFREDRAPGQSTPTLTVADNVEMLDAHGSYADKTTDMAGRFPGSKGPNTHGMSIDERLPMKEEYQRRIIEEIAGRLEAFLRVHPQARWDFAAGPALQHAVLDRLSPAVRERLRDTVQKDLTNVPIVQLQQHFRPSFAPVTP